MMGVRSLFVSVRGNSLGNTLTEKITLVLDGLNMRFYGSGDRSKDFDRSFLCAKNDKSTILQKCFFAKT